VPSSAGGWLLAGHARVPCLAGGFFVITFTEAQLVAWISPILWPFLRVLAVFTVAPVFSMRAIPMRVKVGLAFLVALCAQAVLTHQPVISVNGREALGAVAQQVVVGLAIGFAVRLVFSAVELAGEIIGLQMGLNFASFFDPTSNAQVSAVARFFGNMATLLFVVINGHLMVLMAVVKSFDSFPADGNFLQALGQMRLHELGASLFSSALWIALPMIALLTFVNLTLGIISRVAPQMNVYAVGFPVTLTVGLVGIAATLPMLEQPVLALMQQVMDLFEVQR
jgi:flagellar biosynthetic protein FliR